LRLGEPGKISDPQNSSNSVSSTKDYPSGSIAFAAEFFLMPTKNESFFSGSAFKAKFPNLKNPVFSRNLVVLR
jgi:hypothetical protein